MATIFELFAIALGGALGASCRFYTNYLADRSTWLHSSVTGTVLANSIGCFLAGLLAGSVAELYAGNEILLKFLTVGFLGSYTTFSTFTFELVQRLNGPTKPLLIYVSLQLIVAVGLTAVGYFLAVALISGGAG